MRRLGLTEFLEANRVIRNPRHRQVARFPAWLPARLGISPFQLYHRSLSIAACAIFAIGPPQVRIPTLLVLVSVGGDQWQTGEPSRGGRV